MEVWPKTGFLATCEVMSLRGRERAVLKIDWMVGFGR